MRSWLDPGSRYRQQKRASLVAGLLTPDCAECPARAGQWCIPVSLAELVRIDQDPPHVIHSTRVVAAADGGHARRDLLIAQFAGGPLPSGLTSYRTARNER